MLRIPRYNPVPCAIARRRRDRARVVIAASARAAAPYDLLLSNGRIVDGTGSPWFSGDVAIRGDTIAQIAPAIDEPAARVIDVRGQRRSRRASSTSTPTPGAGIVAGAHRAQLRAAGRDDGDGGTRRIVAAAARAVSRAARGAEDVDQHRQLRRPGLGARRRHRRRQPQGDARRDREDGRPRRAGHEGRRVRPEHRALLRARHVHADRRGDRARARPPAASAACTSRISATTRRRCSTA